MYHIHKERKSQFKVHMWSFERGRFLLTPYYHILPLNHSKDGDPLKSHHGSIADPNHQVLCPLSRHKTSCSTRISENCCSKSQSCCCSFSRCCLNSSLSDGTIRGWSKLGYLGISKDTLEHLRTLFADPFSLKSQDSTLGRVPFDICELRRLTFLWAVARIIFCDLTSWRCLGSQTVLPPQKHCGGFRQVAVSRRVAWESREARNETKHRKECAAENEASWFGCLKGLASMNILQEALGWFFPRGR